MIYSYVLNCCDQQLLYNYVTILNEDIGVEYDTFYIYQDLKIKNGEVKMIFDVMLRTAKTPVNF
jgi:hypothetical protein